MKLPGPEHPIAIARYAKRVDRVEES